MFINYLAVLSIYLAIIYEAVAFDCDRILIHGCVDDNETLEWASHYCSNVDVFHSKHLTLDLLDALSTTQVVLSDGSDDLIALLALCPHEVVLLLKYPVNLEPQVNDSTVAALGYTSCDVDVAFALTCWRLPHEKAPESTQRTLVQFVSIEGNILDDYSPRGFELGINAVSCFNYFNASRGAFAQELTVRIRVDGVSELHLAVPMSSDCSLNTLRTFIEVVRPANVLFSAKRLVYNIDVHLFFFSHVQAGLGAHIVELELGFFFEQIRQFIPFSRQSHRPSVVSVAPPSNPVTVAAACHWASALPLYEVSNPLFHCKDLVPRMTF